METGCSLIPDVKLINVLLVQWDKISTIAIRTTVEPSLCRKSISPADLILLEFSMEI